MSLRRNTPKQSPWPSNHVCGADFTVNANVDDTITVNVQLLNQDSGNLTSVGLVKWWISTDAAGLVMSTALHGSVAAGSNGTVVNEVSAKSGFALSNADGEIDFDLLHVGDRTVYLCIGLPDGSIDVSSVLTYTETGTGS